MPKHTFAAFQHVSGKIIPAYRDPVEIDMLDVRNAEPCQVTFHGRVNATIVTMSSMEQHILDVPHGQFVAMWRMETLYSPEKQS